MQYHISDTMKTMQGSAIREMFKTMAKPGIISFAGGNPYPLTFPVDESINRNALVMFAVRHHRRIYPPD